ncbi:MFS transporter [Fulvivirga sp. RKSG066]|uniref:MFS transporter n=1 Tax=Fulvivirga aurantia TaxID=2529383 RepID=UPI0012BCBF0C|nr:MFS transporter [Fulvivirga aurantia]MTI22193.1 MFS transporter [Fulvivirga aurantia]
MNKPAKTYTLQFWLLCLSSYLFFASFNMIIPELPDYLTSLGGEEYKGLIISLFTLTAGFSRPFSGKLTDKVGRIPVMVFGAAVCFVIGFLYPILTSVGGFLFLRFIHGFSTGFKPTGTVAYVADIVPLNRRGEAMGLAGVFGTMGMASGPAIGSEIALQFSLNTMFYASSATAILSVLILVGMKETLANPERFKLSHLKIKGGDIFDKSVVRPSIIMVLNTFSFGIMLTIVPDLTKHIGIMDQGIPFVNKGVAFLIFTVASLFVRLAAGRASDVYGREPILLISSLLYATGMFVVGAADSITLFLIGNVIFGIATGMNSPTIFAWATDLSHPEHRGRAMATVFIALEIGIMSGAFLSGLIYDNQPENFAATFWTGGCVALVGFSLLIYFLISNKRRKHAKD